MYWLHQCVKKKKKRKIVAKMVNNSLTTLDSICLLPFFSHFGQGISQGDTVLLDLSDKMQPGYLIPIFEENDFDFYSGFNREPVKRSQCLGENGHIMFKMIIQHCNCI